MQLKVHISGKAVNYGLDGLLKTYLKLDHASAIQSIDTFLYITYLAHSIPGIVQQCLC